MLYSEKEWIFSHPIFLFISKVLPLALKNAQVSPIKKKQSHLDCPVPILSGGDVY